MKTVLKIFIGALVGILLLPYVVIKKQEMPTGCDLSSPFFIVKM